MKKLILAAVFLTACSQKPTQSHLISMQLIDRNGQTETISQPERIKLFEKQDFNKPQSYEKILRVYSKNTEGKNPSIITTYHKNGSLFQQLEAVDGRAHGAYKEYYETGQIRISAFVIEGTADLSNLAQSTWVFDGTCDIFYPQGGKMAQFCYDRGKREGEAIYFHENGQIKKTLSFKNDVASGDIIEYDSKGVILARYQFVDGKQSGPSSGYFPSGQILYQEMWQDDLLMQGSYFKEDQSMISKIDKGFGHKAIYQDAELVTLIEYKRGVIEGGVQNFDAQGFPLQTYHLLNNQKHGEEIIYYEHSHQIKMSLMWQDDQITGLVKTYYKDGSLESQKSYQANKKNGPSSVFYPTGELMMLETYSQDRLIEGKYFKKGDNLPASLVEEGTGCVKIFDEWGGVKQEIHYEKSKVVLQDN